MQVRLLVAIVLMLVIGTTNAAQPIAGTYRHSYTVPNHPLFPKTHFGHTVRISKATDKSAYLLIEVHDASVGSSCSGYIEGVARRNGQKLTLTVTQPREGLHCTVVVEVANDLAQITHEYTCSEWHGVSCGFESDKKLARVRSQRERGARQ